MRKLLIWGLLALGAGCRNAPLNECSDLNSSACYSGQGMEMANPAAPGMGNSAPSTKAAVPPSGTPGCTPLNGPSCPPSGGTPCPPSCMPGPCPQGGNPCPMPCPTVCPPGKPVAKAPEQPRQPEVGAPAKPPEKLVAEKQAAAAVAQDVLLVPKVVYMPYVAQVPVAPARLSAFPNIASSTTVERRDLEAAAPGPSNEDLLKALSKLNERLDQLEKQREKLTTAPQEQPPSCPPDLGPPPAYPPCQDAPAACPPYLRSRLFGPK